MTRSVVPWTSDLTFPSSERRTVRFTFARTAFSRSPTTWMSPYSPECLPATDAPLNMIAGFWDDLTVDLNEDGSEWIRYSTETDPQRCVIEWLAETYSNADPINFEIILYPNGEIVVQYQTIGAEGDLCTVGLQNGDGTDGLNVVCNGEGTIPSGETAVLMKQPGGISARDYRADHYLREWPRRSKLDRPAAGYQRQPDHD